MRVNFFNKTYSEWLPSIFRNPHPQLQPQVSGPFDNISYPRRKSPKNPMSFPSLTSGTSFHSSLSPSYYGLVLELAGAVNADRITWGREATDFGVWTWAETFDQKAANATVAVIGIDAFSTIWAACRSFLEVRGNEFSVHGSTGARDRDAQKRNDGVEELHDDRKGVSDFVVVLCLNDWIILEIEVGLEKWCFPERLEFGVSERVYIDDRRSRE